MDGPEDAEMTGLEVTSTFTANVWEVRTRTPALHSSLKTSTTPAGLHTAMAWLVATECALACPAWDYRVRMLTLRMPRACGQVRCKVGDVVAKGQTLVVLEAMKMEYPIAAPASGQVRCPWATLWAAQTGCPLAAG
jgi:biotin carboxyl carrier protein